MSLLRSWWNTLRSSTTPSSRSNRQITLVLDQPAEPWQLDDHMEPIRAVLDALVGSHAGPEDTRQLDPEPAHMDQLEPKTVVGADLLGFARGDPSPPAPRSRRGLDEEIAEIEIRMITDALATSGNNRSEAARMLGISRVGLLKKLDRLGLTALVPRPAGDRSARGDG